MSNFYQEWADGVRRDIEDEMEYQKNSSINDLRKEAQAGSASSNILSFETASEPSNEDRIVYALESIAKSLKRLSTPEEYVINFGDPIWKGPQV